jgi:hypothetical protein
MPRQAAAAAPDGRANKAGSSAADHAAAGARVNAGGNINNSVNNSSNDSSDSGAHGGELAAEQMSVRELMQLETREALELARGRARNHRYPDSAPAGAGPGREGLKLVAIYGVGKKLLAEVRVGSRPQVYLRGQALPLGAKADAQVYRLHGITGSCVHLERRGEAHTLCLHPSQWAGG